MNLFNKFKEKNAEYLLECFPFEILIVLFWDLALFSKYTDKQNILWIVIGTVLIHIVFIYTILCIISKRKDKKDKFDIKNSIINPYLFVIFVIFVVCFSTILKSWLNLDGHIYYSYVRDLKEWDFTWNKLMLAGHMSQGYTLFLMIGEFLFPNNPFGVRIIHCIMALISIYCFYLIVYTIMRNKNKLEAALYTAIFAFSPMLLGLIGEVNTDFPTLCFLTWMICCGVREKYIRQALCGILLCFSKETGCLLYGSYILGCIIFRIIKNRRQNIKMIIKSIISTDMILFVFGGVFWGISYLLNNSGSWVDSTTISTVDTTSQNIGIKINTIAFFPYYILKKIQQLLYINCNWILYTFVFIAIFANFIVGTYLFRKKIKIKGEILIGASFSFCAFLIYNFLYVTYNHYRYLLPFAFFLSLGVSISLMILIRRNTIRKIIAVCLVCVVFISNFCSLDPIAENIFMKQGTGTGSILIPCTMYTDKQKNAIIGNKEDYACATINTSGMYNFQSHYLSICFDKTLKKIDYKEDSIIIIPSQYRDEYGTLATIFGVNVLGYREFYWDTKRSQLNINCVDDMERMKNNSRYQKLNYRIVNKISEISQQEMQNYKNVYYIALPFDPEFNHDNFLEGRQVDSKETVQYFGWKWNVYKMK